MHDQKQMEMCTPTQHRSVCVSCFNVQDRSELEKTPIMSRRVKFSLWLMLSMPWHMPFITWIRICVLITGEYAQRWSKQGERSCWSISAMLTSTVSLQMSVLLGMLSKYLLLFHKLQKSHDGIVIDSRKIKTLLIIYFQVIEPVWEWVRKWNLEKRMNDYILEGYFIFFSSNPYLSQEPFFL